jgi:hypothetical protein
MHHLRAVDVRTMTQQPEARSSTIWTAVVAGGARRTPRRARVDARARRRAPAFRRSRSRRPASRGGRSSRGRRRAAPCGRCRARRGRTSASVAGRVAPRAGASSWRALFCLRPIARPRRRVNSSSRSCTSAAACTGSGFDSSDAGTTSHGVSCATTRARVTTACGESKRHPRTKRRRRARGEAR